MGDELMNLKQNWIQSLDSFITSRGFEKTDWGYEQIEISHQPGQTISFNGHVMQQQGKEIKIQKKIILVGDGWVADSDEESNKMDFTQVKFEAYRNGDLALEYEEAIYWDESDYFTEIFNQIFG